MSTSYDGVLEVDRSRGVIYFHLIQAKDMKDTGCVTLMRACGLQIPENGFIDITMPKVCYAVGSNEGKFIVDRIYLDREEAITYCKRRDNKKISWSVITVPFGGDFIDWEFIGGVE